MKLLIKAAVIAAALSTSVAANATMFDFSYTFTDGQKVSGSLDGTLNGTTISNISDLQVSLDGIAFAGGTDANGATSLKLYGGFNEADGLFDAPSTFSTVASQNNFIIADEDPNTGSPNYFFSFANPSLGAEVGAGNFLQGNGAGGPQGAADSDVIGTWNVAPVPLPAALPLLLSGLGLFGIGRRRRAV